eukprot:386011_1
MGVYDMVMENAVEGTTVQIPFTVVQKDEAITRKKNEEARIRTFQIQNLGSLTGGKQYTVGIDKLIKTFAIPFEMAIGLNHNSDDWRKAAVFITCDGDTAWVFFDGDWKRYDKKILEEVFSGVVTVYVKIAKLFNWSELDITILRSMLWGAINVILNYAGDLIETVENASGSWITTLLNSIANSILIRMSYVLLHPQYSIETRKDIVVSFRDNVHMLT